MGASGRDRVPTGDPVFRRNKSILGLDLGSQAVKAVEITLDGDEPVITGLARIEVAPGASRAQAVAEALQSGRFRTKNVVTSVAGQSVVVRYISMVEMSDHELRHKLSAAGRETAEHAFTADKHANAVGRLYDSLLHRDREGAGDSTSESPDKKLQMH